ncbi:MAG TPA: efflux RND transporter periplasmic adaptor subunit [Pseudolabrys sp.]|nr:efflux RND transporter periplasmic adaptor subunit [Pseudolabrys sp.]
MAVAVALAGCGKGQSQQQAKAPPPPAVTVANPVKKTVTDYDEYVGRFAAVNSVEVRARVSGYLDSVDFKDGQLVKKGDLLFTIDKRTFQNSLDQAKATLAQAKSNLAYAQADLERGQSLVKEKTITQQTFEQRTQAARNAQASLTSAEAAVRQAQLDLEFTELRAPIDGRIGARQVSPGNLVTGGTTGNTTLLATIVSTDPIYFEFTFDEASYLRYQRLGKNGHDLASPSGGMPVSLKLIDENKFDHKGRMDFVNNVISKSTGTILGRAVFKNPNGLFTPGMFARIRVPASAPYEALLVPDTAIGSQQTEKYVLVVNDKSTAQPKPVTLGQLVGSLRVIKSGLAPGDKVIVNGLARVRPGQKVKAQEQGAKPKGTPAASVKPSKRVQAD